MNAAERQTAKDLKEAYKNAKPGDKLFERDVPVFIGWNLETVVGKGTARLNDDERVEMVIQFAKHDTDDVLEFFSTLDPMALSFGGYNRIKNYTRDDVKIVATKGSPHPLKMNKKEK